jgi:hypothetical protein
MQETNHLKNAHYAAMHDLGYSDEEIKEDWEIFVKEYEEFLDVTIGEASDDYRPFGSSVPAKPLSAEEAEKLRKFEYESFKRDFPW